MSRLKVLQVSHGYDPPFLNVANFYTELFDPQKYEVTSLFLKGTPIENAHEKVKGEKVMFLNTPTLEMRGLKLGLIKEIKELILKEEFDIVIAQRYKAIYLVGMASFKTPPFKFIGVIHAYNVFKNFTRRMLIKKLGAKITLLGVSNAIRDDIKNYLRNVKKNGIYSLPNCIPVEELKYKQLSKKDARSKLGIPEDAFVFGTAGRLHPEKDHETLIKAFALVQKNTSHVKLYIMGEGRLKVELQELINSLALSENVHLLGMVPDGASYFKAFDVFVLPSKLEPFGMVIIEAMAAEVPVISSKSGGAVQIVEDEKLLFNIGDVENCKELLINSHSWSDSEREQIVNKFSKKLNELYSEQAFFRNFWNLPVNSNRVLHLCHKVNPTFKTIINNIDNAISAKNGQKPVKVYLYPSVNKSTETDDICLNLKRSHSTPKKEAKIVGDICLENGVSTVISHRYKAGLIAGLLKSSGIIQNAFSMYHGCNEFKKAGRQKLAAKYMKENTFIAVSQAVKDDLQATCPAALEVKVIYNSLSPDFEETLLSRSAALEELELDNNKKYLGLIGRLTAKKGFADVIHALSKIQDPDLQLVVIGNGDESQKLKSLAGDLNLLDRIQFKGHINNASKYFKAFDLIAIPSRTEGFGLTALEAIMAEVPVIAAKTEGLVEVLGDKGCYFTSTEIYHKEIIAALKAGMDTEILKKRAEKMFSQAEVQKAFEELFS